MTDTTKLELYTPNHFLLNASEMSMEALAVISDSDVDAYEEEHAIYLAKQKDAVSLVHSLYKSAESNISLIFGEYSNEHKYLARAINKGGALTDSHSKGIPSPRIIRDKVNNARKKVDVSKLHTVTSSVNDNGLLAINNALEYLINSGLKLNQDFTLTNAIAVAKSHKGTNVMAQVLADNWSLELNDHRNLTFVGSKCVEEDCDDSYDIYSSSDSDDIKVKCSCGEKRYNMDFSFQENGKAITELI